MPRFKVLYLLLALTVLAGAGCYTVLRHPETYDTTGEYYERKACSDCHADADLYHYTERYGGGWYEYYPAPWAYYYQSPWWYEDYWYYTPDPNDLGSPPVTGGRTLWNRGLGSDPDPLPSQGGDAISPPLPADSPRPDTKENNDKPVKPKPTKKKKRTIWGR